MSRLDDAIDILDSLLVGTTRDPVDEKLQTAIELIQKYQEKTYEIMKLMNVAASHIDQVINSFTA